MRKIILAALLAVILIICVAAPVLAADPISPPDSMSIVSAKVVRNTVEPGDMAIVFHYNLAYADYPDTPASQTMMFRLYSPDGLTLLATAVPYVFFSFGYGNGVSSFYFNADTAPTWGQAYLINIAGSPAYFETLPEPYYYTITSADYSGVTDKSGNQELMKSYILTVCDALETAYLSITLKGSTDVGMVLTATGEAYFRGAVPGLASIAPSLFFTQFYVPKPIPVEYDATLQESYTGRLDDSDLMSGFDAIGEKAGVTGQTVGAFAMILLAIGLLIFTNYKGWGSEPGVVGAGIILTLGAVLLGDAVMTIRFIMALIAGILIFYQLFLKKA